MKINNKYNLRNNSIIYNIHNRSHYDIIDLETISVPFIQDSFYNYSNDHRIINRFIDRICRSFIVDANNIINKFRYGNIDSTKGSKVHFFSYDISFKHFSDKYNNNSIEISRHYHYG